MVIYINTNMVKEGGTSAYMTDEDYQMIAKYMINIEMNQEIYAGADMERINSPNKFNVYEYKDVKYEINNNVGVISIYENKANSFEEIENKLDATLRCISRKQMSIKILKESTQHTLVIKKSKTFNVINSDLANKKSYRKFGRYRDIERHMKNIKKCYFMWYILSSDTSGEIYVSGINNRISREAYLMRAPTTIICDKINMFMMEHQSKQLDYPSLNQYTMYSKNRIVDDTIYISNKGLEMTIFKHYIPHKKQTFSFHIESPVAVVSFSTIKITRVDPSRSWNDQIADLHIYEDQEKSELNDTMEGKQPFPNDICYISKIPLAEQIYVIKIKQPVPSSNLKNKFSILVSTIAYYLYIDDFEKRISELGFKIICCVKTQYPRSILSVIENMNINPVKKCIMTAMEKYGCCISSLYDSSCLFVVDPEKKQIYIGMTKITDKNISCLRNNNSILFKYKNQQ